MVATRNYRTKRYTRPQRPHSKKPQRRWKDEGVDFARVRAEFPDVLRKSLGHFERKLNRNLLQIIEQEFLSWLKQEEKQVNESIRSVPRHARAAWIRERYESSGESTEQESASLAQKHPESRRADRDQRSREHQTVRFTATFLFAYCDTLVSRLTELKAGNLRFRNAATNIRTPRERQQLILRYAAELGASPRQLRGDQKAFQRWFDEEAMSDRYSKQLGETELLLTFVLDRMATVIDEIVSIFDRHSSRVPPSRVDHLQSDLHARAEGMWKRLQINQRVRPLLNYEGDNRVKAAAFRFLAKCTKRLPAGSAERILETKTRLATFQGAMNSREDVWVQCDAFNVLFHISVQKAIPLLLERLANAREGDDMFVRRHLLEIVRRLTLTGFESSPPFPLGLWKEDPSPFVRQKLAEVVYQNLSSDSFEIWRWLAREDVDPKVRSAALLAGINLDTNGALRLEPFLQVLEETLRGEEDAFVLRTALYCCEQLSTQRVAVLPTRVQQYLLEQILPTIGRLQATSPVLTVRRWSAHAAEKMIAYLNPASRNWLMQLQQVVQQIPQGKSRTLPKELSRRIWQDPKTAGRLLAVLSQKDFGLDVQRGLFRSSISRGPKFGFRLWRLLYEFRNPATDKRQALNHTVGRLSESTLRAPSQICGELSETKIPGEPLTLAEEGSWRPFLPLPDDFVSVLNRSWLGSSQPTQFFTSQGVTQVRAPRSVLRKCLATWKLTWQFDRYASLRNWKTDTHPPSEYVSALRRIGFEIEFEDYSGKLVEVCSDEARDASVHRFFDDPAAKAALPIAFTGQDAAWYFDRFADYFVSPWENTLEQLVAFAGSLAALTLAKHGLANWRFRRARRNIPLSIGGWGTRGKSGTERLKAALIGVTGHGLVSKTTGCEAMFIHGDAHGEPLEIPLFRPYDKATIWEQHDLLCMASKMNPSVFLWECMALTPSYVDVLQRQWTNDDIGTITNTYPDHEDLQGPAGHNVATTISGFVPRNSLLLTTEEMMRPYVAESCREVNTAMRGVGWLESGLITNDILDRFPYQEHPDNIALVAEMGNELGYGYDYCLKAMADYLVPDLGVLKTHPASLVRTRRIEFTNGMSANERFGCMGNWQRLGFAQHNSWDDASTWISGVVNNRADRVPRSKVFAKIVVDDIQADRFFLIGSNLKGLIGFIEEAWKEKIPSLSLGKDDVSFDDQAALAKLLDTAKAYRQPTQEIHVQQKLSAMVEAILMSSNLGEDEARLQATSLVDEHWQDPETLRQALSDRQASHSLTLAAHRHHQAWLTAFQEVKSFQERIVAFAKQSRGSEKQELDREFARLVKSWFDRRIVVVENYDASGEEVVSTIVDETPPGFLNRAMGLQNIKGTGLDFVYRFQAWDVCYNACETAIRDTTQGNDITSAARALQAILAMPQVGQLCVEKLQTLIQIADSSDGFKNAELAPLLEQLKDKLAKAIEEAEPDAAKKTESSQAASDGVEKDHRKSASMRRAIRDWAVEYSEHVLDVHDSVRRRKKADQIYHDLAHQRIGRQRAVSELRKINKRQKGGWLASKLFG